MSKFSKNKIIFIILLIIILCFSLYKIFHRNYPILKPKITIKYNDEKVLSSPGEHSWFNIKDGGNSYLVDKSSYEFKEPIFLKKCDKIYIKFSHNPKEVTVKEISNSPYLTYKHENNSKKEYFFIVPDQPGKYIFEVTGLWDDTHTISEIFSVYVN